MIMVVENDFNSAGGFENMTIQSTPYQSYQHRQNWMRIWTRSLSPTENVLLIPKSTSLQPETSKNPIPIYAKENQRIWLLKWPMAKCLLLLFHRARYVAP